MNAFFLSAALALIAAQLTVPRKYIFVPLLIGACHLASIPIVASLTIVRLLLLVGLIRAIISGNLKWSPRHPLDCLIAAWAAWAVLSSFGHANKFDYNPFTIHLSMAYDYLAAYLFTRANLRDTRALHRLITNLVFVLCPLALLLLFEKFTGQNAYAIVGAAFEQSWVREDKVRAAGPFGNAILAGTLGGTSLPLVLLLYRRNLRHALIGCLACVTIVYCSGSSGPYMSLFAGLLALYLWRWRQHLGSIKTAAILTLVGLAIVMKAPIWYLIARVDIAGGSTSWHRAEVIEQAVRHFSEWWLVGSDYTRHWMAYGIQWTDDHIDITNHYIFFGVRGGLLLLLLFVFIISTSFRLLGKQIRIFRRQKDETEFLLWCLGSSLFSHSATFFGVSYFDQSFVFLCILLGAIPGLCSPLRSSLLTTGDNDARNATALSNSRTRSPLPHSRPSR